MLPRCLSSRTTLPLELFGDVLHDAGDRTRRHVTLPVRSAEGEALGTTRLIMDWSYRNEAEARRFIEHLNAYAPRGTPAIIVCTAERRSLWTRMFHCSLPEERAFSPRRSMCVRS